MTGGAGTSASANSHTDGQRHCLVMDEVDGMAGNEDRGGMQVGPPSLSPTHTHTHTC